MRTPRRSQPSAATAFAPESIDIGSRHVQVGGEWVSTLVITGYPREVHPGWLQPLLSHPGRIDVSVHIHPVDPVAAADKLKKQLARLESGRTSAAQHGRLADPLVEAATEDAHELAARVARGEGRLFRLGLHIAVHADTEQHLAAEVAAVRALAASLLLDAKPTTFRSLQGWTTTLPLGLDLIGMNRIIDTAALAASFPFASPDLPPPDPTSVGAPAGVLIGYNLGSQGLVFWDRFALPNYNAVILGRSGAGKSFLVKLETLRSLYRGVEVAIIDPEDEYRRLADAVGGTHIALGAEGVRINPLDLPIHTRPDGRRSAPSDALRARSLFLHTLLSVLFDEPVTATERPVLDQAITATYQRARITEDPRTWTRPAPLLRDLRDVLAAAGSELATGLATRLHPFVEGSFATVFDGPTTTVPEGHLLVFSLRGLAEELRSMGTLLALDTLWRRVANPASRRPRLVVVDEAWLIMQRRVGAEYLWRMAKAFRKHWGGLTVASQDIADLLASDLGKAIVTNSATQILLRQAPQAIDEIVRTFALSEGERQYLLSAEQGQGLISDGTQRVAFHALASPTEYQLITTDPAELAALAEDHEEASYTLLDSTTAEAQDIDLD